MGSNCKMKTLRGLKWLHWGWLVASDASFWWGGYWRIWEGFLRQSLHLHCYVVMTALSCTAFMVPLIISKTFLKDTPFSSKGIFVGANEQYSIPFKHAFSYSSDSRTPNQPQQTQDGGRRPAAVLPEMERLPDQHGLVVQAPPRRKVLHRRHPRLRRTDLQGAQDGPVCLLTLLQGQHSIQCVILT